MMGIIHETAPPPAKLTKIEDAIEEDDTNGTNDTSKKEGAVAVAVAITTDVETDVPVKLNVEVSKGEDAANKVDTNRNDANVDATAVTTTTTTTPTPPNKNESETVDAAPVTAPVTTTSIATPASAPASQEAYQQIASTTVQQTLVPTGVPTGVPGGIPMGVPMGVPGVPNAVIDTTPHAQPQAAIAKKNSKTNIAIGTATLEGIIVEKDEVATHYVGRVIGKGGEQIRDLQARSGCKIDVDQNVPAGAPRVITYQGTRKTIDFAKQLVTILCSEGGKDAELPLGEAKKKHLQVPATAIGKIIGRGGDMIKVCTFLES